MSFPGQIAESSWGRWEFNKQEILISRFFLLVLNGDKFLFVPTQQNRDGGALFLLLLITIILFPVRKETVYVRQRMI
jgi:hypothetical protein